MRTMMMMMKATNALQEKTSAIEISRTATSGSLHVRPLLAISFLIVLSYTRVVHWRGGVYRVSNETVMDSRKGCGLWRRKVAENHGGAGEIWFSRERTDLVAL